VVLLEPEIPPNTGAIGRTCAATGSWLHLIEPLGFQIDQRTVRRAGLDYWPDVKLKVHPNWTEFEDAHRDLRLHFFSANASRSFVEADYRPGDAFVFGRESVGLPESLWRRPGALSWAIPTSGPVRSLNLSNAAAVVLYHAFYRVGALDPEHVVVR